MKIAFTGTSGTGKTTLATHISETWGLPFLANTAREVMKELGVANEEAQLKMSEEELLVLQLTIYDRIKAKRDAAESFVSDRCLLDNYVYALRRCGKALTEDKRKELEYGVIDDLYKMDLVFYTPGGLIPLISDGVRLMDSAHNHLIDAAIYGLLCRHGFDKQAGHIYVINMSDRKRREHYVDALVSALYVSETTTEEGRLPHRLHDLPAS